MTFPKVLFPKLGSEGSAFLTKDQKRRYINGLKCPPENRDPLDPYFEIRISGNIFDHKEDDLGIISSPILGLSDN